MIYSALGRTGLRVLRLGSGVMRLPMAEGCGSLIGWGDR